MTDKIEIDSAGVSRRNALKAGAALGVGAAAFAGPQIGVLGAAPAYAQACSPGKYTTTDSADRNVDCGGACGDVFRLHGTTLEQGPVIAVVDDKVCADSPDAIPTITGIQSGDECEVQAGLYNGPSNAAGPFFTLPSADFNQNDFSCSSRYILRLVCAPIGCL